VSGDLDSLVRIMRKRGCTLQPETLERMLGRGAITPAGVLYLTGSEVAQELAQRIRDASWDGWRHETFRSVRKARRLQTLCWRCHSAKTFGKKPNGQPSLFEEAVA